jgi:hypothetical protein
VCRAVVTSRIRINCSPGNKDEEMILSGFDDNNARNVRFDVAF